MMTIIKNLPGNIMKLFQKPSASDELTVLSREIRAVEQEMKATVHQGVGLTGPDATINRTKYCSLKSQLNALNIRFDTANRLAGAKNAEAVMIENYNAIKRMQKQIYKLGDPEGYENAADEMASRQELLRERTAAINEASERCFNLAPMEIPVDDEYTRLVNGERAHLEAQKAAAITQARLDARDEMTDKEGEIIE